MAEINTGEGGGKDGRKRSKKMSTKVDMTPMVDLAFLLITFFMVSTSFTRKYAMDIQLPQKTQDPAQQQKVPESRTINLILGDKDKIYWYEDPKNPQLKLTNYSDKGLREVLLNKRRSVDSMIVIVKPMGTSTYKNLVDVMDEVKITSKKLYYSIVDVSKEDEELVSKFEGK